jgi:hypothetical protein
MQVSDEAMRTYGRVNKLFKDNEAIRPFSFKTAQSFICKAWKEEVGRDWHYPFHERTKKNEGSWLGYVREDKYSSWTYTSFGIATKGYEANWKDLVHSFSHFIWWYRYKGRRHYPKSHHNADHACLELRLAKMVLNV